MTKDNTPSGETVALSESERFDYERLKKLELQGIEDYQKFLGTEAPSPERLAAWIHQLSPWNLHRAVEALKEREHSLRQAIEGMVERVIKSDRHYADLREDFAEELSKLFPGEQK